MRLVRRISLAGITWSRLCSILVIFYVVLLMVQSSFSKVLLVLELIRFRVTISMAVMFLFTVVNNIKSEVFMQFRKKISKKASQRIFRKTASRTLKINSAPPATRGGIRL